MKAIAFLVFLVIPIVLRAQQVPDFDYDPKIDHPVYAAGKGPLVFIDEAHHNFHTIAGRYNAFTKVLQRDGYVVKPNTQPFTKTGLQHVAILVIANALNERNVTDWAKPNPSAFAPDEIQVLNEWVKNGGSLFLIADHMPIAGANEDLAKSFGFTFYNGFATDTTAGLFPGAKKELDLFRKTAGTLAEHPITKGITSIATFTGQAFTMPPKAVSLLTFDEKYQVLLPDTAWKFHQTTPRIPIKGFSQGAVSGYGKGRLAIFGEAAMFSSQLKGRDKMPFGLKSPDAGQNQAFLLNLIHWLDQRQPRL
ncbi:DUF4350 domain-containing protein [Larkinella humicola]|uniref:DUF4350 domain-containing protein n=1 Tax=Larkinella humicola TaxID=2607654 RepID=A0A5N1J3F7_9BACT|nr:DUF4350 domain-containing protein [Larkinella humicola]KAA9341062.1 DUF4350 domain-containing protein [Larkinella humicola]